MALNSSNVLIDNVGEGIECDVANIIVAIEQKTAKDVNG
jgi:hypothetical protein